MLSPFTFPETLEIYIKIIWEIPNNFKAAGLILLQYLLLISIMNKLKIYIILKTLVNSGLKQMLLVLFLLLIAVLASIGFSCVNLGKSSEAILVNILTELLGMIVTYFIIDLYIEKQSERRKNERQSKALQDFDTIINKHYTFLYYIYKATNALPAKKDFCLEFIQTEEYFSCLKLLKIDGNFSDEIPLKWAQYYKLRFIEFDMEVNQIMNNYVNYIDNISQVSNFLKHQYINYIIHIFRETEDSSSTNQLIDTIEFFKLYVGSFVSNCKAITKIRGIDLKIQESEWKNIVPPKWNSASS